jgi:two-component system, response regulator / RNA-binding antiterminator
MLRIACKLKLISNAIPSLHLVMMGYEKRKAATNEGISACGFGSIPSERLTPVINATTARFKEAKETDELAHVTLKSGERVAIEGAKELLMRQRNLEEVEAYAMLRTMAMQRNMKIVDLSNQLLEVAKMLIV